MIWIAFYLYIIGMVAMLLSRVAAVSVSGRRQPSPAWWQWGLMTFGWPVWTPLSIVLGFLDWATDR